MNFKMWLEMSAFRDLLKDVPQDPGHHPEGPVFTHVRMVRRSMDKAIDMMRNAQSKPGNAFANFNLDLTKDEINILRLAAWMHDIGKAGATTLNVGGEHIPWTEKPDPSKGRWQSIGHERPKFYKPEMQKLMGTQWQSMWDKARYGEKRDLFFIINNHMGLTKQGFGKRLSNLWIDEDGKYKDLRRIKLLLILVLMDRIGRGVPDPEGTAQEAIGDMQAAANELTKRRRQPKNLPAPDDPMEFIRSLAEKPPAVIRRAFIGKFGREPTPDEL